MDIKKEKLFFHTPYRQLLERIDLIGELLINCEIYVSADALDTYTQQEIDKLNGLFDKFGLHRQVHGPFMDLSTGSFDRQIREVTCFRFRQALEFCRKANSKQIVFHTHFHPIFYRNHFKKWLNFSKQTWESLIQEAKKADITIVVENSIESDPQPAISLVETLDADNFRACFDVGHYNAFSSQGWQDCLLQYKPEYIKEVHLSDNDGTTDQHLRLGEGKINFKEFFALLSSKGIDAVITVEPHALGDIKKSIGFLESL